MSTVKIRRSGTTTSTPSSLDHGELAINYADGKLFWKDASNTIQSFVFQAYATATHTHSADAITSGTVAYARLPVGSTTSTVCAGDDARLSDARTPTAHKASHATGGSDALTPGDIGAAPAASPTFTGTVTVPGLTSTGVILADDAATANSVVYSFDGDPNTGIGRGGADILTVVTNGSERVRVDASGNIEAGPNKRTIGVSSRLHVSADNANWGVPLVAVCDSVGRGPVFVSADYSPNPDVGSQLYFNASTGGFTIGCTSPGNSASGSVTFASSQIVTPAGSAAAPALCISGDTNTGIFQASGAADTLSISTAGSERVRVTSGGNVGLGTTSPATPGTGKFSLDVNGPIIARGGVAAHQTSGGVLDLSGDVLRIRSYGATAGTGIIDFRIGGGGGSADAHGARIDASANLILGSTASPTGSRVLMLVNGTAPSASIGDCVMLYSEDVSSSAELKVRDEAGNVTTLSPHNFDLIPEGPSEPMAWAYYSERDGHRINVDMLRLARLVERLTGEKLVYEAGP